ARAWEALGRLHARSGRPGAARAAADKAVAIAKTLERVDPAYAYDLACTLELRNQLTHSDSDANAAIDALQPAIAAGFDEGERLRNDPRLPSLRSSSDFPRDVGLRN